MIYMSVRVLPYRKKKNGNHKKNLPVGSPPLGNVTEGDEHTIDDGTMADGADGDDNCDDCFAHVGLCDSTLP